jgi:nitrogen-specific signal transduction histidine kinase
LPKEKNAMKSLLLVADTPTQLSQLHELLATTYTLYATSALEEALEYLQLTKVDVVLAASEHHTGFMARLFEQAKTLQPQCVTLCIAPARSSDLAWAEPALPPSDFLLRQPFGSSELRHTIEQALEKQRLVEEIAALRASGPVLQPPVPVTRSSGGEVSLARIGQILRNFAKAFSTNLDLPRSLNLFVEAISEFLQPSRLSILVLNRPGRVFEIRAHRGLAPKVAEQLRLRADEGLPQWLMSEGRLVQRREVESQLHNAAYREIQREMQALKAVVSIPLLASGTLIGILNLGDRVTGVPYTEDELEILCSLGSQVAVGIQDITLYQTMQAQKVFTEKILRYMSSGVMSIDGSEKISLCNHRAAQILGKSWTEVLHEDLRGLPSPLGDLLYETLHDGKTYHQHEVLLAARKVPLEINTYQILNEHGDVSGSVMVFDDLTVQKLLYEERRRADQLDFLTKVVGRLADEIKNPLVSIQTFVELLADHHHDPEFTDHFRGVVSRDIRAIDGITEKLVSFVSQISYRFESQDIQTVLQHFVAALTTERAGQALCGHAANGAEAADGAAAPGIELATTDLVSPVQCDVEQFHTALRYLAVFLLQDMGRGGKLVVASSVRQHGPSAAAGEWVYVTLTGKGRKLPAEEVQHLFDPFCMDQNTLVDVGPCVSQKIIAEHGGHLEVHQEKNGDTTFVIALPVAQEPTEATTQWTAVNVF